MFDSLKKLFECGSTSKSIALRTQLHTIKMNKSESVASYFTRVAELRDQLGDIGETISKRELSIYILRGLPDCWESFIQNVSRRSKMLKYDRLWADCTEEEARLGLQPSMVARMMRTKHLQLVLDSGKERRSLAGETSAKEIKVADQIVDLVLPEVMRGRTTRRFSALDAKNLVTSSVFALTLRASKELL